MELGDDADSKVGHKHECLVWVWQCTLCGCMITQVEEATLPGSKSDEKSLRQSTRTRSSKNKAAMKNEELAEVEQPQENGDLTEDQLLVSSSRRTM